MSRVQRRFSLTCFKDDRVFFFFFAYVDDVFEGTTSPIMVKSELVGPLFSFDVLLDFVSYFDDVPTCLYMDLSFFFFNTCVALVMNFFLCILFIPPHRSLRFIYSRKSSRDV